MAIRRCPYCKAIIDESQKYCNNCGTQLLFPEDESEEEDVKGEKIVDDDLPSTSEEDLEESLEPAEDEAELEKEEIDLEDIIHGGGSLPDEIREPEEPEEPQEEKNPEEEEEEKGEIDYEEEEEEASEKPEEGDLEIENDDILLRAEEKLRSATESDLDLGDEEGGEDEPEEKDLTAGGFEGDTRSEFNAILAELKKGDARIAAKSDLPPWAESIPGPKTPAADIGEEEPAAEPAAAQDGFAPGDTMDFQNEVMKRHEALGRTDQTMGIPESVTKLQEDLPFLEKNEMPKKRKRVVEPLSVEEDEEAGEEIVEPDAGTEAVESAADLPAGALPKLGFFRSLKALLFDLVFVAVLWAVAMILAAGVMNVGLLPLVRASALPAGLLFLALLTGYFFLFLFFLGETLGRRLAAPRD